MADETVAMSIYMTTSEVADLLRIKPGTLRSWRRAGRGPAWFKAGRRVLYRSWQVQSWITDQAEDQTA